MKRHLLFATASAFLATGALAADLPAPLPIVEEPVILNWTGVYFGLQGGYAGQWFDDDDIDFDGFVGGGHVGYLYQFQNGIVIGGEADIEYSGMDGSAREVERFDGDVLEATGDRDMNLLGSVRARAGYAFGNILAYATGGYAFANVSTDLRLRENGVTFFRADQEKVVHGYTVGGGVEALLGQNVSLGVEYRWTDLQDTSFTTRRDFEVDDFNNDFHAIRARISYHF